METAHAKILKTTERSKTTTNFMLKKRKEQGVGGNTVCGVREVNSKSARSKGEEGRGDVGRNKPKNTTGGDT